MPDHKIAYEPHPVSPERKAQLRAAGYTIVDAVYEPKSYVTVEEADRYFQSSLGTDSGDQFSDEQLRAIITEATGKAPHPQMGRKKLIAQFNALNAKPE